MKRAFLIFGCLAWVASLLAQPTITQPPINQVLAAGNTLTLSVTATGTGPLAYQWFKDSRWLWGATNTTLTVTNAGVINSGTYSVMVTNASGMVISQPALAAVGNYSLLDCGNNLSGQLGNGANDSKPHSVLITVASNVVAAAAGGTGHSLFVTADGRLWAMGYNGYGELGNGTTSNTNLPVSVASNVVAVAAGAYHSLFVKADGTLWAMGYNNVGQLGIGTANATNKPVQVASNAVAVAAGDSHSLFIKADGTLWAMGYNGSGQLGIGTATTTNKPVQVASNVVAVVAGYNHSLFLTCDNMLWGMGANYSGQLGNTSTGTTNRPVQMASNVVAAAAGSSHSLFLTCDNMLWGMGANNYGQLGDGTTSSRNYAAAVLGGTNVMAVAAGYNHSLFLQNDGTFRAMGYNNYGQLADITTTTRTTPVQAGKNIATFANVISGAGAYHTLAIGQPLPAITATTQNPLPVTATNAMLNGMARPNGIPVQGWFEWGLLGSYTATTPPVTIGTGTTVVRISTLISGLSRSNVYQCRLVASNATGVKTGAVQWFRVDETQKVTAWGSPPNSAHGYGQSLVPQGLTNVMAVAGGAFHSLALQADGTVRGWGLDTNQQTDIPASVTNVVALGTGYGWNPTINLALRNDGTVGAWGSGATVPDGLSNVVAVAAGDTHGLALKADGKVVAWGVDGFLNYGQTNVPVSLTNAIAIGGGAWHSLALMPNGKVVAWGNNTYGQINVPSGATNAVAIAAGSFHNLALRADGTVLAWGDNVAGQINVPAGLTNVVAIAAGGFHSLALKSDGTVVGWGAQGPFAFGQATVPVGLSNVVAIACGGFHSLVLGANVPPVAKAGQRSGYVNQDLIFPLPVSDGNNDPVTTRIVVLPTQGNLYQYADGARGLPITTVDTVITDVSNRVIFVPVADGYGSPYTTFSFVANDGQTDSALAPITINIFKNMPAITWYGPYQITYGTALSTTQLNASANVPGSFQYTPPTGTVLDVGFSSLSVVFTPTDTVNYSTTSKSVSLAVLNAPLTVTANNASRAFGQPDPVFTGNLVGLQNGDNITAIYSSEATASSPPGTYAIVPALVDPSSRLVNYTVTNNNGTLTVFMPPQSFTASSTSGVSGQQLTLQMTGTPNYPYILQMATNLTPPIDWQSILTNAADASGNWTVVVTNTDQVPIGFYRVTGQ